ncbi:hypothetical protein HGRIS_008064 [Hohenbuehelia grisea]|uniref:UreD-domain-containing protein n=1 Tax=Hohenbuehelia grisea TaxID=104357 RepID=A0ABR3J786_9AGAR
MDTTSSQLLIPKINLGGGRIVLSKDGPSVAFAELSSTYPLKLLSPHVTEDGIAVVYALTYGGGLVGGDQVNLTATIGSGATLVLLSQGSTKVFKTRLDQRKSSNVSARHTSRPQERGEPTTQRMEFEISGDGALFLLPEPVTCFRAAAYNQIQTFRLDIGSSAVILDWVTSGRKSLGEEWDFSRYYSLNEVWVGGTRIAKDVMLLDDQSATIPPLPRRTLRDKLAPYSCFATLILVGPLLQPTIARIATAYEAIVVFKRTTPEDLIWSTSPIPADCGSGSVVRVAGKEPEAVKRWLKDTLGHLEDVIGTDIYRRAFL